MSKENGCCCNLKELEGLFLYKSIFKTDIIINKSIVPVL